MEFLKKKNEDGYIIFPRIGKEGGNASRRLERKSRFSPLNPKNHGAGQSQPWNRIKCFSKRSFIRCFNNCRSRISVTGHVSFQFTPDRDCKPFLFVCKKRKKKKKESRITIESKISRIYKNFTSMRNSTIHSREWNESTFLHSLFKIHLKYFCSIEKFILVLSSPPLLSLHIFGFNFSTKKIGVVKSFRSEPPSRGRAERFGSPVTYRWRYFGAAEENGQGLAPCLD